MTEEKRNSNLASTLTLDNFSSTTKLASNEVKIPVGSKESINEKDYDPYEHRVLEHPNSTAGSLIHLLKSSLGSGILAMPMAFKNAGLLFGAIGTIVIGFLCTYCVHIFVKVSYDICKRSRIPSLGFSETAGAAFEYGPKPLRKFSGSAKIFVDIALVFTYFMGNCVYIVFIAESLEQLFDYWIPEEKFSKREWMLIIGAFLILSGQVRELKHLVPFSFLANIFMVISFAITLYYMFVDIPDPSDRDLFAGFSTLPLFFSTVIFAMEGIGVVMPVENNMARPQLFLGCPGVLNTAMSTVVILYATIGFFGYLKFGNSTEPLVTLNLPVTEIPAQVVKLLIALSVFFTYNLQMYVPMDIIWRKLVGSHVKTTTQRHIVQVIMRCVFVAGTVGMAIAVPNLEPIIGLVGSICFSTLGLLVPAVVETVVLHEDLGAFKWRLIKNTILAAFAIFALVSGTADSVSRM